MGRYALFCAGKKPIYTWQPPAFPGEEETEGVADGAPSRCCAQIQCLITLASPIEYSFPQRGPDP